MLLGKLSFNEVDMQPIKDLRAKYGEEFFAEHGTKLGFMGFFVSAAVQALRKFPIVNASIDNEDIVYHGFQDIGVAVSTDRGLESYAYLKLQSEARLKLVLIIKNQISLRLKW